MIVFVIFLCMIDLGLAQTSAPTGLYSWSDATVVDLGFLGAMRQNSIQISGNGSIIIAGGRNTAKVFKSTFYLTRSIEGSWVCSFWNI